MSVTHVPATDDDVKLSPHPINAGVRIGHVHLKVADIERARRWRAVLHVDEHAVLPRDPPGRR